MSDSYGTLHKKVVFHENEKVFADLKIRLRYDGLTQQQFFSSLINGYLSNDARIAEYIFDLKDEKGIHSKKKRKGTRKMYRASRHTSEAFKLNEDEVQDIFDILREENSDL
tara:strand:+ start:293 stop:625 length:333 start_codon:yes stop_codon:yes gene_type:complete